MRAWVPALICSVSLGVFGASGGVSSALSASSASNTRLAADVPEALAAKPKPKPKPTPAPTPSPAGPPGYVTFKVHAQSGAGADNEFELRIPKVPDGPFALGSTGQLTLSLAPGHYEATVTGKHNERLVKHFRVKANDRLTFDLVMLRPPAKP